MAEDFLRRWSRLKREHERAVEQPQQPVEKAEGAKPAEPAPLPPVEKLTPESDFTSFMQPKVQDNLRRAALKKLFVDPHFNTPDPFEPFSGDWRIAESISPDLLATLNQAKVLDFDKKEEEPKAEEKEKIEDENENEEQLVAKSGENKPDEPGRQDS